MNSLIKSFKKRFTQVEVVDPMTTTWRNIAVIDLSKPWLKINAKMVLVMDILDRACKDGHIQWRMQREGDLASFEAYCNEAEFAKIQTIFAACN